MQKKSLDDSYNPAEDTFFVADYIEKLKGKKALDIGTGSGYLANVLKPNFDTVVASDIDLDSLNNQKFELQNLVCCNAADAFCKNFDLVVCNLPYLPSDGIDDRTTDGGKKGVEIPKKILSSAIKCVSKNGKIVFLTSSLANYEKLIDFMKIFGFQTKVVARKKLFYEELILVESKL